MVEERRKDMPFRNQQPLPDLPLNPPDPRTDDHAICCVCEEDHDRLELINFGCEEFPELVCLEITCLVDFITRVQEENANLVLKIARLSREIKHAI